MCKGAIDNTSEFGNIWDGRPIWSADFTGDGKIDILFHFPGDDNWWLGKYDDSRAISDKLYWTHADNTQGFGHGAKYGPKTDHPTWISKYSKASHLQSQDT